MLNHEARSRFWIWLEEFSSYVIIDIYIWCITLLLSFLSFLCEICYKLRDRHYPLNTYFDRPTAPVIQSGWPGFSVSEISLYLWILCKIFDVFIWGGGGGGGDWLGSRELVFSNHDLSISVELAGNFAIRTVQPSITGMKAGWILAVRMVSSHEFLMRTQGEIGPGNLASAVNQVCVEKP